MKFIRDLNRRGGKVADGTKQARVLIKAFILLLLAWGDECGLVLASV